MNKIDKIIQIIRYFKEEGSVPVAPTNNASSGAISGFPPDSPPVFKNRKNKIYLGLGSRKKWMRPKE